MSAILPCRTSTRRLAATIYDRRIQLEPDVREPYFLRGNVKAAKQDYAGAKQDYDLAVARNDKPYSNWGQNITVVNDFELFRILFNRANVKVEMRDYEGALEDYKAAIQHNPEPFRGDLSPIFFNRANAKVHLCRFQEAAEDYDEAIRRGVSGAYFNKGNVLVRLGHFDEALQCYDKWVQEKKQKGDSFGNRDAVKSILEKIGGRKFETTTSDINGLMLIRVPNCWLQPRNATLSPSGKYWKHWELWRESPSWWKGLPWANWLYRSDSRVQELIKKSL